MLHNMVQCLNARKNLYVAIRFFMLNIAKAGSCELCLNRAMV